MHMSAYAGLLSINVTLFFRIATESLSNIFCDIELGFDVYFK